jgi:hypothetical protein
MSYRKVIESIDGWEDLTEAQILFNAKDPIHLLVDRQRYTLEGIAGIIGDASVGPLIDFLETIGYGWIKFQAGGAGLSIGDPQFNAKLLAIPHPSCQAIAAVGRRLVSLCELNGLPESDQQISSTWQAMKLERTKAEKRRIGSTRWNNYAKAIDEWDGSPETEPVL